MTDWDDLVRGDSAWSKGLHDLEKSLLLFCDSNFRML